MNEEKYSSKHGIIIEENYEPKLLDSKKENHNEEKIIKNFQIPNETQNISNKNNSKIIETIIKEKEDKNYINLSITNEDIQDMNYEKAILNDKRSYFKIYWSFLIDTQIILETFFTNNSLNLFIIKLSFFIYTFQISFFLNALFYTDEYISNAYHNNGVLEFIAGLPKSIYSFIARLITTNILNILSNSKSELIQTMRELIHSKDYELIINNKLRKLRNKLIAYFILVFSLGLFFLYYVSAFCATYRHSQKYWFIGCVESFAIDAFIAAVVCLLLAFFRIICLRKKIKFLYVLANIISKFL